MMPREYQFSHDLRHLVYFQAVAEHLHFRKAAEALGVAQPALSRQIAQLEEALGVALFLRSRRRVELTEAGSALQRRVVPLLQTVQRLPAELQAVASGQIGHVRIAFTGLAMATVLPEIIRNFSKQHPKIRLELNESPTAAQLEGLRSGDIDAGFFHPDISPSTGLHTQVLLRERNGILLPNTHPLSHAARVRLKDLADTPFVLFPRPLNPGFYDRCLTAFAQAKITPHIAEEVWPRANGIGLVRAGLGATFITPSEAQNLPTEVVFRPLVGPTPESRLVVGSKVRSDTPPAVAAFIKIAEGVAAKAT